MPHKKRDSITLGGVIRLKIINSPDYFNKLAKEAIELFEAPDAHLIFTSIATESFDLNNLPPIFAEKANKLISKVKLTAGNSNKFPPSNELFSTSNEIFAVANEFLPAIVTFEPKEKITIRHDVLAEITLKDGIITKITPVPSPQPF